MWDVVLLPRHLIFMHELCERSKWKDFTINVAVPRLHSHALDRGGITVLFRNRLYNLIHCDSKRKKIQLKLVIVSKQCWNTKRAVAVLQLIGCQSKSVVHAGELTCPLPSVILLCLLFYQLSGRRDGNPTLLSSLQPIWTHGHTLWVTTRSCSLEKQLLVIKQHYGTYKTTSLI